MTRRRDIGQPRGLTIATCQFPVGADIRANGAFIRRQMREAARRGAELAHFSEAALSGYAGAQFHCFDGYPWDVLAGETRRVRALAAELGLWTILGTTHRPPRGKPLNSLCLIAPTGRVVKRYDKCFLLPRDRGYYEPGNRIVTHSINGIRFGLLICFDFRFPEIWRECLKRRCRLIFLSSYLASPKRNPVMESVAPATMATRAAENFFWVVANNTTGEKPWCGSRVVRPDGSVACEAPPGRPAILTWTIRPAADATLYNPIGSRALEVVRAGLPWEAAAPERRRRHSRRKAGAGVTCGIRPDRR